MTKKDAVLRFIAVTFALICLLTAPAGTCFAQNQPESEREKVHLHLDKPSYIAGDTIWFKAYVAMAGSNTPSLKSKVLHVDVIDEHQKIIRSLLLRLSSGLASGDIILPDILLDKSLHIRAYTNWMRNFGAGAYFDKTIPLANGSDMSPDLINTRLKPDTGKTDISFFPEGGELITGLRSKVGVKVTGSNGLGEVASGEIVDQDNKLISNFKTTTTGIDAFPLTPLANKNYTAVVKLSNGRSLHLPIPNARPLGYVLTVNNRGNDSISVNIAVNNAGLVTTVVLLAQTDQMVYYSAKMKLAGLLNTLMIPRSELPAGVVRLTLLSAINEPLAERLVFNTSRKYLQLKIVTKDSYTPGEKALITVTNANRQPLTGSFSMAVTSRDNVPVEEDDQLTIQSNLLLASDLKGAIAHPNYYFNAKNTTDSTERQIQLDNLLLTQGWRRFIWTKNAADSICKATFDHEDGLHISGKLLTSAQKPIVNSKVSIYANIDGLPFLADTLTGKDGSFILNELDFDDPTKFVIQAKDVKNKKDVKIILDTASVEQAPLYAPLLENPSPESYLVTNPARIKQLAAIRLSRKTIQLKQVNIKAEKTINAGMPGGAAFAYSVMNKNQIVGKPNLRSVIEQANPYIRFDKEGEPKYVGERRLVKKFFVTMVDGVLAPDNYMLQVINPEDVESIEIHNEGTSVGELKRGIIVINTKKKNTNFYRGLVVPGVLTFSAKGYSKTREFYAPKYIIEPNRTDLRDIIYWNPNVTLNNIDKAVVEFYNSGNQGNYDVTIEGITADGRLARTVYTYSVK